MERLSKKEKGLRDNGQQCGDRGGEWDLRGLNGNGKNIIKIKAVKKYVKIH